MPNDASSKAKDTVRLDLTPEQRQQVRQQTGKDAEAIELGVEELEQRIAPLRYWGVVDAFFADLGSRVGPGQVLATVDRSAQEIAVARAALAREGRTRTLERARELARRQMLAPAELEDAEQRDRASAITLREAQHARAVTRVVAPFAGTVTARYVGQGRLVAVGDTLFRVTESGPYSRACAYTRAPRRTSRSAHRPR